MIKIANTTHHASDTNAEGHYIPKSYRFERDLDNDTQSSRFDSLQFSEQSNTHFVHHDIKELLTTTKGQKLFAEMLTIFFSEQKPRLEILDGYSRGHNHTILTGRRRLENEKSDYRVTHNWGGYISNYITGYVLGKPVTIGTRQADDDEATVLENIVKINRANDIDTLNFELGFDTSRYGRAFEFTIVKATRIKSYRLTRKKCLLSVHPALTSE